MDADELRTGLRRFEATLRAEPRFARFLVSGACPACGGRLLSIDGTTKRCKCRGCGHEWTEEDTDDSE
jgi:uncharacterized protein (DUF983 family)